MRPIAFSTVPVAPFIGRDAEIGKLSDFLGGPEQPFRWMVLHGSGGVGKSRLALELCLAIRDDWHAGFLPQEGEEPDWGRWQPRMPTLIVIDPAALDTDRTGQLLRALAGRGPEDATMRLAAPVRVLLVERTSEGEWLKKIMGDETKKAQLDLIRAPNLRLTTIGDLWPIFNSVLEKANKPLPDKAETFAGLEKIDPERRPLFAHFMADAILRGVDIRHFDGDRLLEDVIEHGRDAYWKPAGATAEDERLLVVATMAGGLAVRAVKGVKDELLPSWSVDHHPKVFRAMTGRESGKNIAPLEPDIVGEKFVLTTLADEKLSDEDRARICEFAWRLGPLGMRQFMLRAQSDLPDHAMLPWVRKLPPAEGLPQFAWATAAADVMHDLAKRDLDAARALLDNVRGVADKRKEDRLWGVWVGAAHNLMIALGSRDPAAARELLGAMRRVAEARGEATLWEWWAKSATNLMNHLPSRDPATARALLDDMRGMANKLEVYFRGSNGRWPATI